MTIEPPLLLHAPDPEWPLGTVVTVRFDRMPDSTLPECMDGLSFRIIAFVRGPKSLSTMQRWILHWEGPPERRRDAEQMHWGRAFRAHAHEWAANEGLPPDVVAQADWAPAIGLEVLALCIAPDADDNTVSD